MYRNNKRIAAVCPTYVGMNREISIVGAVEQRMPHVGGEI